MAVWRYGAGELGFSRRPGLEPGPIPRDLSIDPSYQYHPLDDRRWLWVPAQGRDDTECWRHSPRSSLRGAKRRSNPWLRCPDGGLLRGACHRAALCADPLARYKRFYRYRSPDERSDIRGRTCLQPRISLRSSGYSTKARHGRDKPGHDGLGNLSIPSTTPAGRSCPYRSSAIHPQT